MARTPLKQGKTGSRSINKKLGVQTLAAAPTEAVVAVKAARNLTIATNPTSGDTVTIGSTVYTFGPGGGQVAIGADAAESRVNLKAAIASHTLVDAGTISGNNIPIAAKTAGTAGNSIATTDTLTAGGDGFAGATLTGGVNAAAAVMPDVNRLAHHGTTLYFTPDGVNLFTVALVAVP